MRNTDKQILQAELASTAHVWLLKTDAVSDTDQLAECASILSPDESVAYDRLRFADDRHLYLVSHVMLRRVLSMYADVDPAAWRFSRNPHGRPEIDAQRVAHRESIERPPGSARSDFRGARFGERGSVSRSVRRASR